MGYFEVAHYQALRRKPELLGARLFLGIDYYRTARAEGAIAPLQKAVGLDRKDAQPHLYLGLSYFDLCKYQEVLKEIQDANRLARTRETAGAQLLQMLYSIRSEHLLMEEMDLTDSNFPCSSANAAGVRSAKALCGSCLPPCCPTMLTRWFYLPLLAQLVATP